MATQKLNLTRDQLATFLKDHEQIKQFEALFRVVDQVSPSSDTPGIELQAGNAEASANEALARIVQLDQESSLNSSTADQKATQALSALDKIASALELLATAPVTQNNNSLVTDYIDVRSNAPVAVGGIVGRLKWNDTDGTLDLGLGGGNVTLQIGQENVLLVKNDDTVPLTDGMAVYISGANGTNLLVKRALANSDLTSASTIGIVTETLAINGQGFITTFGTVRGVNTNAFIEGEVLYLSPTTPGAITNVKPIAPQHLVTVGYVEKKSAGNGEIFVKVDNGYEIDELHNVKITDPVLAGSLLIYDATLGVWQNARLTAGTNVSITNADSSITINATDAFTGTVTSVAAITLGTTGTDLSSTVANPTTTPVITLNVPTASATSRGALSSADWSAFDSKQAALVSGTNIKTVGGVTLLGAGDVSAPSFVTVTTSSLVDATTPNSGTTGGFRLRGNATSGTAYLQVTDSTASAQWGYASIAASGLWAWSGAFTATTITASTQFSGAGTGLTGTASSLSIGGNSATATALQTARTIGGVSFNGTANISLPGVDTTGNQNTSGNAATATNVAGSGITGSRNIPAAALPAGTVLQVVSATYSTQVSTASSTYADTGLTATITPTSSTSKILVIVSQSNVAKDSSDTGANIRLLRGASALTTAAVIAAYNNNSTPNNVGSVSLNYLDSPATTSATTYKTQVASNMGSGTCYVQTNGSTSYITLMEIAA